MRVRISYSVDLEDVPDECARRFQEGLDEVSEIHATIESLIDQMGDADSAVWLVKDQIKKCRQRLTKLDMILADNEMILEGYHSTKEPKEGSDVASEG